MSKIRVQYSLKVAQTVIRLVEKKLKAGQAKDMTVSSFSNGREQGLFLTYCPAGNYGAWRGVSIAQQRASDEIIIYYGRQNRFDITTNLPLDWGNNATFYGVFDGDAADFVRDFLLTGRVKK